jgi:urease accessory protein
MILIETILGNAAAPEWEDCLASASVDTLELDHWEAQKSRFRKRSSGGAELAVSLDRGSFIRDGDVLRWDAEQQTLLLARIRLRDVMMIELSGLLEAGANGASPDASPTGQGSQTSAELLGLRTCVELGHALGNQHWPALVKGTCVYVPLTVDRKVMSSVMKTHGFEGIQYRFVPGSEIVPYLAPHESRRLFGAAEGAVHSHSSSSSSSSDSSSSHHSHDGSPSHDQGANHGHGHDHDHGQK